MDNLTMEALEDAFGLANLYGFKYFAVVIQMADFKCHEIIINPIDNSEAKLKYYKNTYNDDLTHKHANDKIKIVDVTFADTFDEIEDDFKGWVLYGNE